MLYVCFILYLHYWSHFKVIAIRIQVELMMYALPFHLSLPQALPLNIISLKGNSLWRSTSRRLGPVSYALFSLVTAKSSAICPSGAFYLLQFRLQPVYVKPCVPFISKKMPWDRNSSEKRKSKSAARAARHREQLGIPEWVVPPEIPDAMPLEPAVIPPAADAMPLEPAVIPPAAELHAMHDEEPSAMEQEQEIDGDDLIAAIDELLAADSSPALLPKESECQTASAETGGPTQAATSSSLATAGSVVNGTEKREPMEPFKENEVEGRDKLAEDEEFVLEMAIREEEELQP